jgi:hypothetical protein
VKASTAAPDLESAAARAARQFHRAAESCVLARLFVVLPFGRLPDAERAWAEGLATSIGRAQALSPTTPVLVLLGTAGLDPRWNDRTASAGHRAIPLVDRTFVESAPMIAALLSSLKLDLGVRTDGAIELRSVAGGLNARFLVEDAPTTVDSAGRFVIAARDFVAAHQIRSVFGMGGSYVGGELAAAIMFTRETLRAADCDRFTSLISSFKMATSAQLAAGRIFRESQSG